MSAVGVMADRLEEYFPGHPATEETVRHWARYCRAVAYAVSGRRQVLNARRWNRNARLVYWSRWVWLFCRRTWRRKWEHKTDQEWRDLVC